MTLNDISPTDVTSSVGWWSSWAMTLSQAVTVWDRYVYFPVQHSLTLLLSRSSFQQLCCIKVWIVGSIPVHLNRSKITGSRKRALCSVKGRISIDRKRRFAIAGRSNATNWIKVEVYTVDYITDVYNDGKLYQLHPFLLFLLAKPPTTR